MEFTKHTVWSIGVVLFLVVLVGAAWYVMNSNSGAVAGHAVEDGYSATVQPSSVVNNLGNVKK